MRLNHNKAPHVSARVLKKITEVAVIHGNPSSIHQAGQRAHRQLQKVLNELAERSSLAQPRAIITSGRREGLLLTILGYLGGLSAIIKKAPRDRSIWICPSIASDRLLVDMLQSQGVILNVLNQTKKASSYAMATNKITLAPPLIEEGKNSEMPTAIAYLSVDPNTGTYLEFSEALALIVKDGKIPCICDASLALNRSLFFGSDTPKNEITTQIKASHALIFDGYLSGGPKGVGAVVFSNNGRVAPMWGGGGQEQGMRPGTQPMALAMGWLEAGFECWKVQDWNNEKEQVQQIFHTFDLELQATSLINTWRVEGLTSKAIIRLSEAGFSDFQWLSDDSTCATLAFGPSRAGAFA